MQVTKPAAAPVSSANFSHVAAGPLAEWHRWEFLHEGLGRKFPGKLFLQECLGLTGMELSLSVLPPGRAIPFLHRHRRNEEVYVFLSGEGEFQVDGRCFPVHEGSVVRVSPEGKRAYRNTGTTPLAFLVIQAPANAGAPATTSDGEAVPGPVNWPPG
jgi:mannose-6-phosphate isomerase-like protein (cupin superfamily)